ncbi:hypothetical protein D9M72_538690 [compost metagenome]
MSTQKEDEEQGLEDPQDLKSYATWASAFVNERGRPPSSFETWKALTSDVMEMALCESQRVVLRIGQAYRFTPYEGCKTCDALASEARESYGHEPGFNWSERVGKALASTSIQAPAGMTREEMRDFVSKHGRAA